ncbi:hypothetical protein [uncultured Lacinutrix sp.]|uniref:hypothetical protein n=1 Tax=uncultured Lacinutrix sp. TaxID=574032 RepID=UPI00260E4CAA|nr:hypothetical protein [uncultured Lacinutrix sp.]
MPSVKKQMQNDQNFLKLILNEISNHIISITLITVIYLLLWIVPQINDLIVVINQAKYDWLVVLIFFSSLSVLAFLISTINSYYNPPTTNDFSAENEIGTSHKSPMFKIPQDGKEIYIEQQEKRGVIFSASQEFHETQAEYIKRLFPKILGTILILIAAFAVNNTFQKIYGEDIIIGGNWGLLIAIILLFFGLNQRLVNALTKWAKPIKWFTYVPIVIAMLCITGILLLGALNNGGAKIDTKYFFCSLLLLATFFLIVSISYNKYILKFKKYIGVYLIIVLVVCAFIAYVILFFNPQALKIITPLSIVMVCIIGIYTVLNLIKLIGHRNDIPLLGLVLIVSVVLSVWTANKVDFSHYDAGTVPSNISPDNRLELNTYVKQWISDRKTDILNQKSGERFPIILVAAEGGGSRAGLWSFLVQSYLYDRNPDYFKKYLFSMTGASGGGVGNNMFYTQAYNLQEGKSTVKLKFDSITNNVQYRASDIYNQDYLSTSVASIMGRDLFKNITDIGVFKDRGALLDQEWENQFKKVFKYENTNPLGEAYLEMMPAIQSNTYIKPLIITNTTHLQSGQRFIISPVKTDRDTNNMAVFVDLLGQYHKPDKMIKRSTAMSMNARFPYLSPVARIKGAGQFGDAGYYDNIGGTVTRRLTAALVKEIEKDTSLTGKYEIKHLLISNYEAPWDATAIKYSSQLTAPAGMIAKATFAHPKEMEKSFSNLCNVQSKRTEINEHKAMISITEGEVEPIIPLGRYLSRIAVRSLEARLEKEEVTNDLNRLIPKK